MPRFKVVFHIEDEKGEAILASAGGNIDLQSELLQVIIDDEKKPARIVVDHVFDLETPKVDP